MRGLVLLLVLAGGAVAQEDLVAEANQIVKQATKRFNAQDYSGALPLFLDAQSKYERARVSSHMFGYIGDCFFRRSRFKLACKAYADGLARERALGREIYVAWFLRALATASYKSGQYSEALTQAREALALDQKAGARPGVGYCHWLIGQVLVEKRCFKEAEGHFRAAMKLYKEDKNHSEVASALEGLAGSLAWQDRRREALERFEEAIAMGTRFLGSDHEVVLKMKDRAALWLAKWGRHDEALPYCQELVATRRRRGPRSKIAYAISRLASVQLVLGLYPAALRNGEEALAMARASAGDKHWATRVAVDALAEIQRKAGHPAAALELLQEALANARHSSRSLAASRGIPQRMGACLVEMGRYDEALAIFDRVAEQARNDDDRAADLANRGLCLAYMGRVEEALASQQKAAAILERIAPEGSKGRAINLGNIGLSLLLAGRSEEALDVLRRSLTMTERLFGKEHPTTMVSLCNTGLAYRDMGRYQEALPYVEAAAAFGRRNFSVKTHWFVANLAELHRRLGRTAEAIPLFAESIAHVEELRQRSLQFAAERAAYFRHMRRFGAFDGMVRAQLAVGQPLEALRYLEQARARDLLDLLARSRFDPLAQAQRDAERRGDEEAAKHLRETLERIRAAEDRVNFLTHALAIVDKRSDLSDEQRKQLAARRTEELDTARRVLSVAIRQREALVHDLVPAATPLSPARLRRLVGQDEMLLIYSIGRVDSLAILVPPAGEKIRSFELKWPDGKPVARKDLQPRVDAYLDGIMHAGGRARGMRSRMTGSETKTNDGATLFATLLPSELWQLLRSKRRLLLMPHGVLHRLPFEALPTGKGAWIDKGPEIVYTPSGSVLAHCRARRDRQRRQKTALDLVALGDPVFGGNLDPLPGTRREVEAIRKVFGKRTAVLLGAEATEENLFRLAPKARHLHLATHQFADERATASFSGLALSVPKEVTDADDGFLKLIDLLEHWGNRLAACELVVLSACETQRGPAHNSEAPFALPLGFMYAGAPSVIASLWKVDDASTAELFADFYARLAKGTPKLQAFAEARQELKKKYPQPYFWAPFIYMGDPR